MNLAKLLSGCVKAIGRDDTWAENFDLSRKGLKLSFIALVLSLPCYFVGATTVELARANLLQDSTAVSVPAAPFIVVTVLYVLTFVVVAYLLTMVFDRQDRFRSWVIVRHWTAFFLALIGAALFGLVLAGVLPFPIAAYTVLGLYLGQLFIDMRLAQKIVGFEWGGAMFTGCLITALGMLILLTGAAQFSGT